jgi:hypothetical protein
VKYAYEDLSHSQFETLAVFLCQELFGISVQGFAEGPDGGRDAKFVGTANLFPSAAAPWVGTTIIQAKHTNVPNRRFSDSDFFSATSEATVVGKELGRIKRLRASKELDHYVLFSNRKLGGEAEAGIRNHISTTCGIPVGSVYLCGIEGLEAFLKRFPGVAGRANLDPVDCPLMVSPDELAELVEAFVAHKGGLRDLAGQPPVPRVSYADKNRINQMSADYAKEQRKRYLKDTAPIQAFLASPENERLLALYEEVVEEFQLKIVAKRKDYQSFDDVLNYLADLLFGRDPVLAANKRLTRAMLFYMYWHCDIGATDDDAEA